jgi:hypothetical protein
MSKLPKREVPIKPKSRWRSAIAIGAIAAGGIAGIASFATNITTIHKAWVEAVGWFKGSEDDISLQIVDHTTNSIRVVASNHTSKTWSVGMEVQLAIDLDKNGLHAELLSFRLENSGGQDPVVLVRPNEMKMLTFHPATQDGPASPPQILPPISATTPKITCRILVDIGDVNDGKDFVKDLPTNCF